MDKKLQAAKERGAKTTVVPKQVQINGLNSLVDQLKSIIEGQQKTQLMVAESLNNIAQVIADKQISNEMDLSELVEAVSSLKQDLQQPEHVPWTIDFDRDQRGLFKSGIRLIPDKPTLN